MERENPNGIEEKNRFIFGFAKYQLFLYISSVRKCI